MLPSSGLRDVALEWGLRGLLEVTSLEFNCSKVCGFASDTSRVFIAHLSPLGSNRRGVMH